MFPALGNFTFMTTPYDRATSGAAARDEITKLLRRFGCDSVGFMDDFENYVHIQSESAIRHIASLYSYDRGEEHEPTLRESADEDGDESE